MASLPITGGKYAACNHIEKQPPETYVDPETVKSWSMTARVLPLFEMRLFEQSRVRHYSLRRNVALRAAWGQFLHQLEGRERTPRHFPKPEDFHFYKHQTLYVPSQSFVNRAQLRTYMFGVGGDVRGYAPVPVELHTRRTAHNVRKPRETVGPVPAPTRRTIHVTKQRERSPGTGRMRRKKQK